MNDKQFAEDPAESLQGITEEGVEDFEEKENKFDYSYLLYLELFLFPILIGISLGSWKMFAFYIFLDLIILFNKRYGPLVLFGLATSWGFIVYSLLTWILGDSSVINIIISVVSVIIGAVSVVFHIVAHDKLLKRMNS